MPKTKQFDEKDVLSKAKDVFSEKGYNGTSMDDLVKATGLSRSSIYDTFSDKHGLFMKTLEYYKVTSNNNLAEVLAKTESPRKKIFLLFNDVIQEILNDDKKQGCLLLNASMELSCVDEKVASFTSLGMDEMENMLAQWVKEGQAKGEIAKRFTPKAIAKHLYNSFAGIRLTGKARPDAASLKEIMKISLSILDE
jgi:TetR/AcrR family transcriptional repressor of nem operon